MDENTFWLKITGKVNIAVPLDVDTDYEFAGRIAVYGEDRKSKNDGTYNVTFSASFVDEIHLIKGEQVILAKDKLRNSQKMFKAITGRGHDYDRIMQYVMRPDIFNELIDQYEKENG